MEYFIILLFFLFLSLYLERKYHIHLYQSRKERALIPLIFFIIGVVWDSFAVIRGRWTFSNNGLLGIKIGVLPIEEYLFFIIVPYAILTMYRVLKKEIWNPNKIH